MDNNSGPIYLRRVLSRFTGLRPTRDGWDALCPCPDHGSDRNGDRTPSLHIKLGDAGRILVKCRVGCRTDAVLDVIGLGFTDLFPSEDVASTEGVAAVVSQAMSVLNVQDRAEIGLCHRSYELLLSELPLSDDHRHDLRRRGIPDGDIDRFNYRSLRNLDRGKAAKAVHQKLGDEILVVPGFIRGNFGVTIYGTFTGLLIPVRDLEGRIQALKIRRDGEPKYVYLTGGDDGPSPGSPIHVPLGTEMTAEVVRVTEGELKADVCSVLDCTPTISVPGVTQWRPALSVLKRMAAKVVVLSFDAPDVQNKTPVLEQAEEFYRKLIDDGFDVQMETWDA